MKIVRRYSMEALAEILHDEELRNGRDSPPPVKFVRYTPDGLLVVFSDEDLSGEDVENYRAASMRG